MPQSLAKIYLHLVFSTKDRERVLPVKLKEDFHAYLGGIIYGVDGLPVEINSEPEHVHLLFLLSRTHSVADVVQALKTGSNEWLKAKDPRYRQFQWQRGYAVFSVSQSCVEEVRAYIRGQAEHHQRISYQDEVRAFLKRHEVEYDEKYVWD